MVAAPRRWTAEEDEILRQGGLAQCSDRSGSIYDWDRIAKNLPGRSNKDCRKRWLNVVAGGLRKGAWTSFEDSQLQEGVKEFGSSWTAISKLVGTRSADQCSKRWQQCLNPELNHTQWTTEEVRCRMEFEETLSAGFNPRSASAVFTADINGFIQNALLIRAMNFHGTNWSVIQKLHFPKRSSNNVKNQRTNLSRQPQWQEQFSAVTSPCCSTEFGRRDTAYAAEHISTPDSSIDTEGDYQGKAEEDTQNSLTSMNPSIRTQSEMLLQQSGDQHLSALSGPHIGTSWFASSHNQCPLGKSSDEQIPWLPDRTSYSVQGSDFNNGFPGLEQNSIGVSTFDCCSQTVAGEPRVFRATDVVHPDSSVAMVEGPSSMNEQLLDRRPQTIFTIFGPHDETILELTKILIQSKKEWHVTQML